MKIKICGVTRLEDARIAADLGADFIGFIFVPESPRFIPFEKAAEIRSRVDVPNYVGVFRDAPIEEMQDAPVDYIQLHGSELPYVVNSVAHPVIKAIQIDDLLPSTRTSADWLLFDSKGGGTGRPFDWSLLAGYSRLKPFFLAGGLNPFNVAEAIRTVRPDAIDVSSGVESAPGIKDRHKLQQLFKRAK